MSLSPEFRDFIVEQMQDFGPVEVQRMFGGAAIKRGGLAFALLLNDTLYLKTDEENRATFEAEGLQPFTYPTKTGERVITGYHQAPPRCLEDPDEMKAWCDRSYAVALRAAARKKPKKPSAAKRS